MAVCIIVLAMLDFTFQIVRPSVGQYHAEPNFETHSLSFAEVSTADQREIIQFWGVSLIKVICLEMLKVLLVLSMVLCTVNVGLMV